jgi:hypothetical protein
VLSESHQSQVRRSLPAPRLFFKGAREIKVQKTNPAITAAAAAAAATGGGAGAAGGGGGGRAGVVGSADFRAPRASGLRAPQGSARLHSFRSQLRRKVAGRLRCPLAHSRAQTHAKPRVPGSTALQKFLLGIWLSSPLDFRTIWG